MYFTIFLGSGRTTCCTESTAKPYDFSLLGNARLPTESSTPNSFVNFIMASYCEIACASLSASGCTP